MTRRCAAYHLGDLEFGLRPDEIVARLAAAGDGERLTAIGARQAKEVRS